ncbi:MAG: hypothetical protein ACKVYV_14240 [Limisphaerales bacterium]
MTKAYRPSEDVLTIHQIVVPRKVDSRTVRRWIVATGLQPASFRGMAPVYSAEQLRELDAAVLRMKLDEHRRRIEGGRRGALRRYARARAGVDADGIITVAEAKRRARSKKGGRP